MLGYKSLIRDRLSWFVKLYFWNIDPFNKIRDVGGSDDVNRYTMEYLQKIEIFAKKYDVLVFIVAHPTKMYKDKDGKIEKGVFKNNVFKKSTASHRDIFFLLKAKNSFSFLETKS